MSSRNWLLKYLKLVTALWVGCPLPEQSRIVDKIEKSFAIIDALI